MFGKLLVLFVWGVIFSVKCDKETVLMTEVFEIQVYPQMFNWTFEGLFIIYYSKNIFLTYKSKVMFVNLRT